MTRATRITDPSYELMDDHNGLSIIYRQHGFPCPLVRWHFHKEYELHLIVASSGKVFIGDYIGNFYPESLFLTGPNLPHNWISQVEEDEVVPKRDMLVNFTDDLFESGSHIFAELKNLAPLLERAQYGIEFRCKKTITQAMTLMQHIEDAKGMARLGQFFYLAGRVERVRGLPIAVRRNHAAIGRRAQHRPHQPGSGLHLCTLRPRAAAGRSGAIPGDEADLLLAGVQAGDRSHLYRIRQPAAHQQVLRITRGR